MLILGTRFLLMFFDHFFFPVSWIAFLRVILDHSFPAIVLGPLFSSECPLITLFLRVSLDHSFPVSVLWSLFSCECPWTTLFLRVSFDHSLPLRVSLDHSFPGSVLGALFFCECPWITLFLRVSSNHSSTARKFFPSTLCSILNVLIGNSRMKIYDWRRGVKSGGKNREVDMKEEMTKLRQYVGAESTFLIVDICPETGETSA